MRRPLKWVARRAPAAIALVTVLLAGSLAKDMNMINPAGSAHGMFVEWIEGRSTASMTMRVTFPDATLVADAAPAPAQSVSLTFHASRIGGSPGTLSFWHQVSASEMADVLDGIEVGTEVPVVNQFMRPERPWSLGLDLTSCGPDEDCVSNPFDVQILLKPEPEWVFGEILLLGGGQVTEHIEYPDGMPPVESYTIVSGPDNFAFATRFKQSGGLLTGQLQSTSPRLLKTSAEQRFRFFTALAALLDDSANS